jgi:hypothetical protein
MKEGVNFVHGDMNQMFMEGLDSGANNIKISEKL